MDLTHLEALKQRLDNTPPNALRDDLWAHLCCEQAYLAIKAGNYGVGAVLVNEEDELVCVARNQVFLQDAAELSEPRSGYQSQRHAEMELLDRLETEFAHLDRRELTLYVSLEPCLMCSGRILLSGIGRVRYLTADKAGGFISHLHGLPPAWKNLASGVEVEEALIQGYWRNFAHDCVEQSAAQMREKVVQAWKGESEKG
ncbi:nucleoside deaminase [Oceanospirillum sanctuarii]|uniref:nucleoside deaminase n=1 Tax=Oceanospirillum sanctuarii TaxID=1434821 RepID=UPI001C3C43A2|nr:nucleoside deaminase [Oceanospirillum sanctuarii]